ncbi:hypothetical protein [Serratia sp. 2723]|uniref:hypothetical protein n=1 Tax=unclassified Serratia (in: enterobacteria) TaxID=2647522 RepID=UPI003D219477
MRTDEIMHHPQSVLPLRHRVGLATVPLGLLLIWLTGLTPLYLPNMGGSGLKLPQNMLAWAMMGAVIATLWLTLPAGKTVRLTVTARWVLLAMVILAIPLLYAPHAWREAAGARWLALFGGWVFYLSLLQYTTPRFARHWLYYAIVIATVYQALIACCSSLCRKRSPRGLPTPC